MRNEKISLDIEIISKSNFIYFLFNTLERFLGKKELFYLHKSFPGKKIKIRFEKYFCLRFLNDLKSFINFQRKYLYGKFRGFQELQKNFKLFTFYFSNILFFNIIFLNNFPTQIFFFRNVSTTQ
jgi:hypothetical protein